MDRLSRVPPDFQPPPRRSTEGPPFPSSYFGAFGDPLSDGMAESYPEGLLGTWPARASMASGSMSCCVSSLRADRTSRNSATAGSGGWIAFAALVAKAHRYGIDVYLYLNEPRSMPPTFFARRPDLAGVREGEHQTLCTSAPPVQRWLSTAVAHVFHEVPGRGRRLHHHGFGEPDELHFAWPAGRLPAMPGREPAEIIAEVNAAIEKGVHRALRRSRSSCGIGAGQTPDRLPSCPASSG